MAVPEGRCPPPALPRYATAMKMELFPKKIMRGIGEHFRRYAHALRFAIGLLYTYFRRVRIC